MSSVPLVFINTILENDYYPRLKARDSNRYSSLQKVPLLYIFTKGSLKKRFDGLLDSLKLVFFKCQT